MAGFPVTRRSHSREGGGEADPGIAYTTEGKKWEQKTGRQLRGLTELFTHKMKQMSLITLRITGRGW